MKVAAVQIGPTEGDAEATLVKAEAWLDRAAAEGVDLAVLPEAYLPGFAAIQAAKSSGSDEELAAVLAALEPIPGPATARIGAKALEHGMHVVFGMLGWTGGAKPVNASVLFGSDGSILNVHRKAHLTPVYEAPDFEAGTEFAVTNTVLGPVGNMICADFSLPETTRILAIKGARIVCGSLAIWDEPSVRQLYLLSHTSPARALDNDLYLVMANLACVNAGLRFFGRSRIIDPCGNLLAEGVEGTEAEQLVVAEIDLDAAVDVPFRLIDRRRPELYGELLSSNPTPRPLEWRRPVAL